MHGGRGWGRVSLQAPPRKIYAPYPAPHPHLYLGKYILPATSLGKFHPYSHIFSPIHRKILISGKRPLDRSEFKQIHVICRKIYEPLRSCPSCLQAETSSFVVWEKARQEWMEGCRHAGGQWTSGGGPRKILTSFSASIYLLSRFIGSRYTWGPICWTGCQYKIFVGVLTECDSL